MSDMPARKRQKIAHQQDDDENMPGSASLFSLLPDELLDKCFSFLGPGHYRYVSGVCKRFEDTYVNEKSNRTKVTFWLNVSASVPCAELCLKDQEQLGRTWIEKKDTIATIGSKAVELGRVEVLAWAHGNGFIVNEATFWKVGRNGHAKVLEWAHSHYLEWYSDGLVRGAVANGHVNVLDFVLDKHPSAFVYEDLSDLASEHGRIDVLEWLKQKQLLLGEDYMKSCMCSAAARGHVAVLDWMCKNGYEVAAFPYLTYHAAYGGRINVLQWALDRNMHRSTDTCMYAAKKGHLKVLQWLRENDCPWDSRVISEAAGHDHIVEWARENGCPEPEDEFEE